MWWKILVPYPRQSRSLVKSPVGAEKEALRTDRASVVGTAVEGVLSPTEFLTIKINASQFKHVLLPETRIILLVAGSRSSML
jgi:hypothetical protein